MSKYLLLQDHFISGQVLQAGTAQSTADVGGLLPTNWPPTPECDPQDAAAVNAFYARGPFTGGPFVAQFANISVPAPITYWKSNGANPPLWSLTGLGAALAPIGK